MLRPTDMLSLIPGVAPERVPPAAAVDGFFPADSMVRRLHRERLVAMILEPPYSGWLKTAVIPLRSALLQLRLGSRFWLDAVRLHPAARLPAGERYGALAH